MAFISKTYEEIRDDILSHITKGVVKEKHTYEPNQTKFRLLNSPVKDIVKVVGTANGSNNTFVKGFDYRLSGDMLEWTEQGIKPDEKTHFFVNYECEGLSHLTDVNPGSVSRTIVEAISREIEFLYAKLNYVYLSAFLDTATGSALDLTVSLLGINRKQAEPSTGTITFGRNTSPEEITINQEAQVFDGKLTYTLNRSPVNEVFQIEGTVKNENIIFEPDIDYRLINDVIEWQTDGKKPDLQTTFFIDYSIFERIIIPVGTLVSTYTSRSEDAKTFETIEEKSLELTPQGRWEANVKIKATEAGTKGNVFAGTITVMPQPLPGIEYVINRTDLLNGVDPEADDELRERARHALEMAGKATKVSLESAIKSIEGVTSVEVIDMPDNVAGIIKIIAQGGDEQEIINVINDTRAAGIKVEFERPRIINLDISINVSIKPWANIIEVQKNVEAEIRKYLSTLDIGDDVLFNRVLKQAFNVKGVYDIKNLVISASAEGKEPFESEKENIILTPEEIAIAREINISINILE
jgi:uncharacterized phage protein gp47/JayE